MPSLPPSSRGSRNVHLDLMIELSRKLAEDGYHPTKNPKGIIDLGSAINNMMHDVLAPWVQRQIGTKQIKESLGYNDTQGGPELLKALSDFMNKFFKCRVPLGPSNILTANGVTTLLDSLTFNIADEGDAILLPTPSYGMFAHDLATRNGVHLVQVPCDDIPRGRFTTGPLPAGLGWSSHLVRRLEHAIDQEDAQGRKVAAILLANPENPLGRCYDPDVLLQVSQLCAKNRLHLVVDEIYAATGGDRFTSVFSLDLGSNINSVHVLWGMSKDFGCGGLRIGFLATYNQKLYETMRTLSMFGWVSAFSATVATEILSNSRFLTKNTSQRFGSVLVAGGGG